MQLRSGDPKLAREINRALVLGHLRRNTAASRTEIARQLNLSKATVSNVMNELIASGLVSETGEGESTVTGGRRPVMLSLNTTQKFVLGVDLGTTNTAVAIANLKGESIAKTRVRTDRNHSVDNIVGQVADLIDGLTRQAGITKDRIIGLGMAVAGAVKKSAGVIEFSPNFNWRNVRINDLLTEKTGLFTIADNCTRVMTMGEMWYGLGQGVKNMFYVNVGFGIGSALVINGELYQGHSEFGHLSVSEGKVRCACGNYGCLETVASGSAIEKYANQLWDDGGREWLTAQMAAERALEGDPEAKAIFGRAGKHLGRAISYIANTFCPDKVIIGGGVASAGGVLLEPVLEAFEEYTMEAVKGKTEVLLSALKMDAGVCGAVAMVFDDAVFNNARGLLTRKDRELRRA